jgi:predicted MFS family arabinose efflux permease
MKLHAQRHPTILALAYLQVCSGLLEVGAALFGAFMRSLGASSEVLGFVLGLGYAAAVLGSLAGGRLTDRLGARAALLGGVALTTLGLAVEGLSASWPTAALGYLLIQWAQMVSRPAALRLIAEAVRDRVGDALGFLNTAYSVVAIGGALLAGWLAQEAGWSTVFLAKTGLNLSALLAMALAIPPPRGRPTPTPRSQPEGWGWLLLRRAPLRYIYAAVIVGTVLGYAPSFLAYDPRLAGNPLALAWLPSIYNAVWLLSNWPIGLLSDRVGRWKVVAGGYALASLAWFLFPWPREAAHLYLLYALYGLGDSATSYAELLAMEKAPKEKQGQALGLFNALRFVGSGVGESCGGLLWSRIGAGASYTLAALGASTACLLVLHQASRGSKPGSRGAQS